MHRTDAYRRLTQRTPHADADRRLTQLHTEHPIPLLSELIGTYQSLSELIRLAPIYSDWFRLILINSDLTGSTKCTTPPRTAA